MTLMFGSWALGLALVAQVPIGAPHLDKGANQAVNAATPDDAELAKVIAPLHAELTASFGRVLGKSPRGIGKGPGMGDYPLGVFLADAMREGAAKAMGAEVRFAITNSGGLRRNIPPGDVRIQDIYEVLPFENELVVAEYTGAELIAIVKEGIVRKGGEPISGIQATVAGTAEHPLATIVFSDGTPIEPKAVYLAATTDYLLANGEGTPTLKVGRHVVTTGKPVRQLVIDLCDRLGKEGQPITSPEKSNYSYSPEITEAIKARSLKF